MDSRKNSSCFLDYPILYHVVFVQVLYNIGSPFFTKQKRSYRTGEMLFTHLSAPTRFD